MLHDAASARKEKKVYENGTLGKKRPHAQKTTHHKHKRVRIALELGSDVTQLFRLLRIAHGTHRDSATLKGKQEEKKKLDNLIMKKSEILTPVVELGEVSRVDELDKFDDSDGLDR